MNILVPIDGTEHSLRAVEFLTTRTDLLGEHPHITIFMAQMPVPQRVLAGVQPIAVDDFYKEEANTVFASVRALLGDSPLDVEMRYSVGMPANDIVAEADRLDADLIIMGIRGHGPVNSFLFGSVSNAVLAHTHRPILMLKDKLPEGTKNLRVGLAVDGSEYSERAVDYVLSHRPLFGDTPRFELLNAGPVTHPIGLSSMASMMSSTNASNDMLEFREKILNSVMKPLLPKFNAVGLEPEVVRLDGNPGDEIAHYAETMPLDLLVMGSHGYGNFRSAVMGSTAMKIAAESSVPLLIIR